MGIPDEALQRLKNPTTAVHHLISTPGFSMPDLEKLEWFEAVSNRFPWLHVSGGAAGNWILCSREHAPPAPIKLYIPPHAKDNVIVLADKTCAGGDFYLYGNGGLVILAENTLQHSPIYLRMWSSRQVLFWGRQSTTNGLHVQIQGDGKAVIVGDDCMFSSGIYIRNSDMHAIIDMRTGEQKNPAGSVLVEPHVWVGQDSLINRNTVVGFGSIVGAKSIVTKDVPRFVAAAGAPAKVVSTDVTWDRAEKPNPATVARLRELEGQLACPTRPPD